jgi:hypothetical protein
MKIVNIIMTLLVITMLTISFFPFVSCAQQMTDYTGQVFPPNHALNMPIDSLPVHPNSNNYVASIGAATDIHPDFGTYYEEHPMGISYNLVGSGQAMISTTFEYEGESDPGPYPIPIPPLVEGLNYYTDDDEGDRHILVIDTSTKKLYETWYTWPAGHSMEEPEDWDTFPPDNPNEWWAGGGAVFDLTSNALREDGWTSADAAGLPIFPLLIRYDEVERALSTDRVFHHPIRFTAHTTQRAYIWPARHYASSHTDPNLPPMGLRFRLKSIFDISGFSLRMQVILRTMKKYGLIIADNGSNWYFQGTHDDRWNDDEINSLKSLHGSDFEAVDISPWMNRPGFDPNSAAVPPASGTSVMPALNSDVPDNFILYQNYPNPFNPNTVISYKLKVKSDVVLKIYDILGREIVVLVNEVKNAGDYTVGWNGKNSTGLQVGSGVYFYQLKTNTGFVAAKKMILIK